MENTDIGRPSTWVAFRPSLCEGCWAGCCTLPVEVTTADLVRMGVIEEDEAAGSVKKIARKLMKLGMVKSFRARSGLFILEQKNGDDCYFLGSDRLCTIYDRRPDVCRRFPEIGPRSGYCPSQRK